MGRFDGKVAWVTGGASGIGHSTAIRFAQEGAKVTVSDIDEDGMAKTVAMIEEAGAEALAAKCDVTSLDDCFAAVAATTERWGRLDAVFANAGVVGANFVEFISEEDFGKIIDVNLNGVFRTAKAALPALKSSGGGGAIVITSSVEGLVGNAILGAYSTSKTAVVGLCRSLAAEGGPEGIRVNCVHPGLIETPMTQPMIEMVPQFAQDWIDKTPLGRSGTPDDVAGAVLFLCSDDASYITGTGITIDGGTLAVR